MAGAPTKTGIFPSNSCKIGLSVHIDAKHKQILTDTIPPGPGPGPPKSSFSMVFDKLPIQKLHPTSVSKSFSLYFHCIDMLSALTAALSKVSPGSNSNGKAQKHM